jgi:phosphoribosylglycinamide formyltransferase-1
MKRIIFLASGNGGSLKSVYYAIQRLKLDLVVDLVIADRECGALEFARSTGIRATTCSYHSSDDRELYQLLCHQGADLIVTNIHKVITSRILDLYPERFVNLHYSLLPAFGGLIGMQTLDEAAKMKVQWVGATAHVVDKLVDHGRVLGQCVLPVDWNTDALSELQNTVFRGACMVLLGAIVDQLELSGSHNNVAHDICGKRVLFNPLLKFDATVLDQEYWRSLR